MLGIRPFGAFANAGAPVLASIGVPADGLSLVLTYDKSLDETSVPANTDFALGATHATIASGGVDVTGAVVTLTFPTGIRVHDFEVPTVSYTAGANPIQDTAGNDAANLSAEATTNNSEFLSTAVLLWSVKRAGVFTESAGVLTGITNEVSGAAGTVNGSLTYSATGFNTSYPGLSGFADTAYVSSTEAAVVAAGADNNDFTLFVVASGATDSDSGLFAWARAGVSFTGVKRFSSNTAGLGRWRIETRSDSGATVFVTSAADFDAGAHVLLARVEAQVASIQVDADAADPSGAALTVASALTPDRVSLGAVADLTPGQPWPGVIAMAVLFSEALAQSAGVTSVDSVRAYLAALWGTT